MLIIHSSIVFVFSDQIKRVELKDGQILFCLWISRDPEDEGEGVQLQANHTLGSSHSSLFVTSVDGVKEVWLFITYSLVVNCACMEVNF